MVLKLNFNLEAWLSDVTIEADNEEEAIKKLNEMSLGELISLEGGVNVKEKTISAIDSEMVSYNAVVEVSHVVFDESSDELSFSELTEVKEKFKEPVRIKLTNIDNSDDLEEAIRNEIWYWYKADVISLDYDIIALY